MAMVFQSNLGHVRRFVKKATAGINKARAFALANEKRLETGINAMEVAGMAIAMGVAQGKYGGISVPILHDVPIDLLGALALHVTAFVGENRKPSGFWGGSANAKHLHAFGDGALASFAAGYGRGWGRGIQTPEDRARLAAYAAAHGTHSSGMSGAGGSASLADEELARMVAAGRR